MKWARRILLGVVSVVLIAVLLVFGLSYRRLHRTYEVARPAIVLPTDSAELARGAHLTIAIGKCAGCHGDDYGGKVFIDAGPFGHVTAPNLTRGNGGLGNTLTDADYVAAITHGVRPDGTSLLFMPSEAYASFSRADIAAVVAYLRTRPKVDRPSPPPSLGPIGRMLLATGQPFMTADLVDHDAPIPDSMPAAVTADYGKYLTHVGGCTGCHNPSLSGGPIPGAPPEIKPAANLTRGGLTGWTIGDFRRALREGVRPGGTAIDSFMPWRYTKYMTDGEIESVWLYLQVVPAKEFGKQ